MTNSWKSGQETKLERDLAEALQEITRLKERNAKLEKVRDAVESFIEARGSGNEDAYGEMMCNAIKDCGAKV